MTKRQLSLPTKINTLKFFYDFIDFNKKSLKLNSL